MALLMTICSFGCFSKLFKPTLVNLSVLVILSFVLSLACTWTFCTERAEQLASVMFQVALGYIWFIKDFLVDYIDLIGLKLTLKERKVRLDYIKEHELDMSADIKT